MEAAEVDLPAIHHEDPAWFGDQHIKCMKIVQFAVGDMDKAWKVAAQIEQRVHLHGGLDRPEMSPWEHRHAQIGGRGIQRIDAIGQVHSQALAGVEASGLRDQPLCPQACLDVAQTLSVVQRGGRHDLILRGEGQRTHGAVTPGDIIGDNSCQLRSFSETNS
jgi:hypothetical protein